MMLYPKNNSSLTPLIVLTCLLMTSIAAHSKQLVYQNESVVIDPIFSVEYHPSEVHFETQDFNALLPTCIQALSYIHLKKPQKLTLYAKYVNGSSSFYILGSGKYAEIVVIRKGVCDWGGAVLSMYQLYLKPPHSPGSPVLSDAEVAGLFEDALIRYEKAFGGKNRFLKWLDDATTWMRNSCAGLSSDLCQTPYDSFQPFRKEQLTHYRGPSKEPGSN